ncbi:multicopper oxidase domain-containing protein [Methyloglobulus sp.]|uniref:multicopper oxidase family protein n=1 Tax=Methyloglobulus sp. TaxID=2518622 RepID=UPI0032B86D62
MKTKFPINWKKRKLAVDVLGKTLKAKAGKFFSSYFQTTSGLQARRTFLKLTSASVVAPLLLSAADSEAEVIIIPPSPPTTPWVEYLPDAITPAEPVNSLNPPPLDSGDANIEAGECGRSGHQRWDEFYHSPDFQLYEMTAKENPDWSFNPAYPLQPIWSFAPGGPDSLVATEMPGPTYFAHYGKPIVCRIYNDLPQNHVGFGTPEISTHLHNLHTGSESDGFPGDYYSINKSGPTLSGPGSYQDHCYSNVMAGYEDSPETFGDYREALGTLFYHDHTLDFTAPNVYRGLSGFYLLFDKLDSGNEKDATPGALKLPSWPYDYPLNFMDRRFDANGILYYDQLNPEGVLGDKVVVNGKIEPVLKVARRKYRLRFLNSGPTRFYELYLVDPTNVVQKFTYIANDGNLLPKPLLNQTKVRLGVAERADIVVNFSNYPIGTELYFVNRLLQEDTRGPKAVKAPGSRVLKIVVDRDPPEADVSKVPNVLRPLPPLPSADELAALPVRRWEFARKSGLWTINDQLVNVNSPRAEIQKGSAEIWELVNPSGGWQHPIHIHFEEGRILSKTVAGVSVAIPAHERGRKDVYVLGKDTTLRVLLRFRDYTGKYVMHCHNLVHEDHAMMMRWDIID